MSTESLKQMIAEFSSEPLEIGVTVRAGHLQASGSTAESALARLLAALIDESAANRLPIAAPSLPPGSNGVRTWAMAQMSAATPSPAVAPLATPSHKTGNRNKVVSEDDVVVMREMAAARSSNAEVAARLPHLPASTITYHMTKSRKEAGTIRRSPFAPAEPDTRTDGVIDLMPASLVRIGSAIRWCQTCGEDIAPGDDACPRCGKREFVDPKVSLRPEEYCVAQ